LLPRVVCTWATPLVRSSDTRCSTTRRPLKKPLVGAVPICCVSRRWVEPAHGDQRPLPCARRSRLSRSRTRKTRSPVFCAEWASGVNAKRAAPRGARTYAPRQHWLVVRARPRTEDRAGGTHLPSSSRGYAVTPADDRSYVRFWFRIPIARSRQDPAMFVGRSEAVCGAFPPRSDADALANDGDPPPELEP
jgi:hypothetical protein